MKDFEENFGANFLHQFFGSEFPVANEPTIRYTDASNPLLVKSFAFAVDTGRVAMRLSNSWETRTIGDQLLRSSASVAANAEEANGGSSPRDFASKIGIALREAREASFWLRYCHNLGLINDEEFLRLHPVAIELVRMMSKIRSTTISTYNLKR